MPNILSVTRNGGITTNLATTTKILSGNSATVPVPLFTIAGTVESQGLWGIVTSALGNNTVAFFRLNDGSLQTSITVSSGATLTNAFAGSALLKISNSGNAITLLNASASRFNEAAANHMELQWFAITAKSNVTTNIEFVYTTTDAPTIGTIQFFLRWTPLSADGNVTPL